MLETLRKRLEAVFVGLVALALGVLGFLHPGVSAAEVDLNDGGVWVTNGNKRLVAHLNYDSQALDGGLRAVGNTFDVSQFGNSVMVNTPDTLHPLDTALVEITGDTDLGGIAASHGDDLILFANAAEDKVWATDFEGASGFNPAMDPTVEMDAPRVVAGPSGIGFAIASDGTVNQIEMVDSQPVVTNAGNLKMSVSDSVSFTIVGEKLVALDRSEGTLRVLGGGSEKVAADKTAVLQQPGPAAGQVALATSSSLVLVPLGAGKPVVTDVPKGEPASPVMVDGCFYGLWAGSGYYIRDCQDESLNDAAQFEELAQSKEPVFRVNRDVVVINDLASGAVYDPLDTMKRIDNWDLIQNQIEDQERRQTDESESDESQAQEFSDEQHPPEARDDEFGARAGTTTTLPVLLNDSDDDGDVLTAIIKQPPSDIPISLAKDGRAIQVEVPESKSGQFSFTYQAYDGEDTSNVATVKVRVVSGNEAPELKRRNTIQVAERKSAEYAVLPDWVDPDGDPMFLEDAFGEEGMAVTFRQDGYITVRDLGTGGPGRRVVTVVVSDGELSTEEEITVQVAPGSSSHPPVANNDHYVATLNETITLRPLANDTDADGDQIRLAELGPVASKVDVNPDYKEGTVQFSASKPGSQTIVYTISDGPHSAKGKIRVDVVDPDEAGDQPSAENDLALLPANGATVVEVLGNDFDPRGQVLVVQGFSMGSAENLTVEVINHSVLRVSSDKGITEPQTFSYTVSNGRASASAKVMVVPMATKTSFQQPVALPDEAVVRVGDIVSVDVMSNDYSPDELPLSLLPEIEVRGDADLGEAFVSGDFLRFKAGEEPGQVSIAYTITDSEGGLDTNTVSIVVKDFDEHNQHPAPRPVEARTFSGREVKIPIPMDGIDPDGDSVELLGVGKEAPSKGYVKAEGNFLRYTPGENAEGTDSFSYRVRDRFKDEGEATVRVGVAPAPAINHAPVAVTDLVSVRPNTKLEIPVTKNDVDPDGDDISLVKDSVRPVSPDWKVETEIVGQKVSLTTPSEQDVYQLYYDITDGGGSPVTGIVTLDVDPDAPLLNPIARDDYVPVDSLKGLTAVEVDVLVNDEDPDGRAEGLKISVPEPATVRDGKVVVPLADERQVVLYEITDVDGLTAKAAVVVPGLDQIPPYLDPEKIPAVVKGGETLTIDLGSYVITRPNHSAKLTSLDSVTAGPGGKEDDKDLGLEKPNDTTIKFTPDKLFIGSTSVSFEVTDSDIDDPQALKSHLNLPIEVESSGLFPPKLRPSEIKVAPGEKPVEVSLRDMVDDPDPGDNEKMAFRLLSAPKDVTATITGQSVSVSAPADKPIGPVGHLEVEVHDGSTDPLKMSVPVTVITSTRPLMNITDWTDNEGRVGKPSTIDLSKLITNPFADSGGEITIVGQPSVTGPAKVSVSGLTLTITPTDVSSNTVVTYVAQDATKDSSRQRTGTVRLVVKDVPNPPTDVSAKATRSRTAEVSWRAGDWRGGQPKGFTVHYAGGSKNCGLVTNCEVTGLTNNRNYTFTVTAEVAESDIEDSAPSSASNQVWVDVKPNPPSAPTAKFGDKKIDLTWPTAVVPDGGSPVTSYTLEITPAASGKFQTTVSGNSYTWSGLNNGTAYTFRLKAHNKHEEDSEWGPSSAPEVPAGAPSNQGAPTVKKDSPKAGVSPRANVTWPQPGNPNGDTSFKYELRQRGSGTVLYSGSANSTTVTMEVSTEDKTFEVRSTNKSDLWSDWSPASNAVRAFQPPGAPTGFSLTPTGVSNQVKFNFGAAPGNGARSNEITYQWSAGGASGTITPGTTITNGAFVNGTNVNVTLTAISTVNGETSEGGTATATVNAYAPPSAPSVSARGNVNDVTLSWEMGASSRGREITSVQIETTDRTTEAARTGSVTQGNGRNQTKCIRARARNSEGQWGDWSGQQCARTWDNPSAWQYRGKGVTCPANFYAPCNELHYKLERYNPNSFVTCSLDAVWPGTGTGTHQVQVDSNGYWSGRFSNWVVGAGINEESITANCGYS